MTRGAAEESTPEEVFRGSPLGLELLRQVEGILDGCGPQYDNTRHKKPGGVPRTPWICLHVVAGQVHHLRSPRHSVDSFAKTLLK